MNLGTCGVLSGVRGSVPRMAIALGALLGATLFVSGCQRDKKDSSKKTSPSTPQDQQESRQDQAPGGGDPAAPVAKIGDHVITLGEFQKRINRQSPYVRGRYSSLEHKKEFLKNMVRFEVLALEAKKRGFDKDPDAINAMKQVMVQKLMKDQFEKAMNPESIPESELRAYYDANLNLYNKPEEVRVSAIVIANGAKAAKVARLAKGEQGSTNKGFRELVAKHSGDEKSRLSSGDLRYFSKANKEIPKAVVEASFALTKNGEVAGPIRVGGKSYIIRQTGRRRPVIKPFEKVADEIRDRVYREKRRTAQRNFVKGLKDSTKIEVFEKRLKNVKIAPKKKADASSNSHGHGLPSSGQDNVPAMPSTTPPNTPAKTAPKTPPKTHVAPTAP